MIQSIRMGMALFTSVRGVIGEAKQGAVSKTVVFNLLVVAVDILLRYFPDLPISGETVDAVALAVVSVVNIVLYHHTKKRVVAHVETICESRGRRCPGSVE